MCVFFPFRANNSYLDTGQGPPNQTHRDRVRQGMQRNIVKGSNKRTKVRMCPGLSVGWHRCF